MSVLKDAAAAEVTERPAAAGRTVPPAIPQPRGALSASLFEVLDAGRVWTSDVAPESDADLHIALWSLYELHYRGLGGVDAEREWDPDLLRLRRQLEAEFETELWARLPELDPRPADPVQQLIDLIEGHDGRSVSQFVHRRATAEQVLEMLRHRSLYHLKEADPTAWVVPRLGVVSKAALMALQFDEYGDGDPNRLHHELFRRGMLESGLCAEHGHYINEAPTEILEMNNAMSLFGLHRRLRGAVLGHLAAFEATSSMPCRRMSQGLQRLGFPSTLVHYYEEHIEADAVHEQLALRAICGAFHAEAPEEWRTVLLGAFSCLDLEDRYAGVALGTWGAL